MQVNDRFAITQDEVEALEDGVSTALTWVCESCGAVCSHPIAHNNWHNALEAANERLKSLVED